MTSDTSYATVRQVDGKDQQTVLDILTEAFMNDPLACWLFPEVAERRRLQPHFYQSLLTHPAAETYVVGRHEGAAVWLNVTTPQPHAEAPEAERDSAFGASGARLQALGQALAQRHPEREPHLYLACMGVVGRRQGAGLGTAMLQHRLERADADGLSAYLEASSPRSRALYLRYGFEDLGEQVHVADSPPLWPMWRRARRDAELR